MAIKKIYDADEIMKMAVGRENADISGADLDGDGTISSADARLKAREGIQKPVSVPSAGNTGAAVNTAQKQNNIYAVSDAYQKQADEIYKKLQETPDFKYDFNEDEVFKALQKQYLKSGKLASEDVAGKAAALSGGYNNSYATTAASQAYTGALEELYGLVPELENSAYNKYRDERTDALQEWEMAQSRADTERANAQAERDYRDGRDAYLWELALKKAELGDYSTLKEMGVDTSGSEYERKLNKALTLAEVGDFSGLKALGIDTANSEYEINLNKALALAEVGDYSGLRALGVDVSNAEKQNALDFALAAAQFGDYSFLKAMGIDTSALETPKVTYSSGGSVKEGSVKIGKNDPGIVPAPYTGDPEPKTKEERFNEILTAAVATKNNSKREDVDRAAQLVDDLIYGNQVASQKAEQLLEKNYFRR